LCGEPNRPGQATESGQLFTERPAEADRAQHGVRSQKNGERKSAIASLAGAVAGVPAHPITLAQASQETPIITGASNATAVVSPTRG